MEEEDLRVEKLDFGTFTVGDRFIIGEAKEGANIRLAEFIRLIEIANASFKGAKWGYISKRQNEYSLQPTIHHEAPKFEKNMVAFAMVTEKSSHFNSALLEKRIVGDSYKFECFSEVETAVEWVREEVERATSS